MRRFGACTLCLTAVAALLCGVAMAAEDAGASNGVTKPPSSQEIGLRLEQLRADASLDEAVRTRLAEIYAQAQADAKLAEDFAVKAADFEQQRQDAPALLQKIQEELDAPAEPLPEPATGDKASAEVDLDLAQEQVELAAMRSAQQELENEQQRRADRRKEIPGLMAALKERLAEMPAPESLAPAQDEPPALFEARRAAAQSHRYAAEAELESLLKELMSYEARGRLLSRRIDQAVRAAARQERIVKLWQDALAAMRIKEAQQAAKDAREKLLAAAATSPAARELAEELAAQNADLVSERTREGAAAQQPSPEHAAQNAAHANERTAPNGPLAEMQQATEELETVQAESQRIQTVYDDMRKKVEAAGLDEVVGSVLRQQRLLLPDIAKHEAAIEALENKLVYFQLKLIDYRQARTQLGDIPEVANAYIERIDKTDGDFDEAALMRLFSELLTSKRDSLQALLDDTAACINSLSALQDAERELIAHTEEFAAFIGEHVLWIQSGAPMSFADAGPVRDALRWFAAPASWRGVAAALWKDVLGHPVLFLFSAALACVLAALRLRLPRTLRALGERAENRQCRTVRPTIEAIALCALLSLPYPALLFFIAWRLDAATSSGDAFAKALSTGLTAGALALLTVQFPRWCLRPDSLAESHFDWSVNALPRLRRHLRWLAPLFAFEVFAMFAATASGNEAWSETLGRSLCVALILTLAVFTRLAAHPRRGAVWEIVCAEGGISRQWMRWTYYPIMLSLLGLGAAAAVGYFYTALRLGVRLHATLCFSAAALLAFHIALRWLLLARRQLAFVQAKRRRKALKAESSDALLAQEEEAINIARVDEQTRRLLRGLVIIALCGGVWFIWRQEIPALNILNRVELWQNAVTVNEKQLGSDGQETIVSRDVLRPITLANFVFAGAIALVALALARNIPGLIEILLHQRTHLMAGERNAISTIIRYAITLLGAVLAFNALGVGWAKVQWLAAALSLGLGFGLQEIFANFVSGLILLFERPIRVGDTVTIGGVSGQVTRIRIRATTILDWDRKELVVPNKEFVTGQLINWTLTDTTIRIVVPVGVDYSTDIALAEATLRRAIENTEDILDNPAPQVFFTAFGSSTLDFEVRVFSPDLDHYLGIKHALHKNILEAFRKENITIAFPQHDVHLDFAEALKIHAGRQENAPNNG